MKLIGVDVLLDINCLRIGVDIDKFMQEGVKSSDFIFWIGSPHLVKRMAFKPDGVTPANPATVEFCHIKEKCKLSPNSLQLLWFQGTKLDDSYPPPALGLSIDRPSFTFDFRDEKKYFRTFPQIAASILGISRLPSYHKLHSEYLRQIFVEQITFTPKAIWAHLEKSKVKLQQQNAKVEQTLNQLFASIPEQCLKERERAKETQLHAFNSQVYRLQSESLQNTVRSTELSFYIPLKGGLQPNPPPQFHFDVESR